MGAELFTMCLCKSKEPQENKEKTQKTFMYLPQRERKNERMCEAKLRML